jgi:hypothetical protein
MNLIENLISPVDGSVLTQLAGQFGLNRDQASSASATIAPALVGGLKEKLAGGVKTRPMRLPA